MSRFRRWLIYKLLLSDNKILSEDSVGVVYTDDSGKSDVMFFVEPIVSEDLDGDD